ncbi:MAG: ABC transporter permease [Gracilimonas sp.]|uniref:ABC transporter permease n=1 Tax=Gracilimonas sp. TaxID=1974203 RepID=UPI00198F9E16|nr:ABC transporter permease [Gracilimonas sp.]MBD3616749.1 ABC transporter permease [Gracilimonas sp.]
MLKNYVKIALRNIRKNPGYSFINILGLAVGIAACVLIFRYISFELSYDKYHSKADRLYRVTLQTPQQQIALTPSIVSPVLQREFPEVESAVRIYAYGNYRPVVVQYEDRVFEESSFAAADSSLFDLFDFELLAGNARSALKRPGTIVVSNSMARKYFGDTNPIGKTLTITTTGTVEYEVTGVMKDIPNNSHFRFDIIASLETYRSWGQLSDTELQGSQFYTYIALQDGVDPTAVESKINTFVQQSLAESRPFELPLQPVTNIHLHSNIDHEIQPQGDFRYVLAAGITALLILIIACINYMNLATARSVRRSREVGIRKVMGSGRKELMGQFFGESAFLTFISLLVSLFLVELFAPGFFRLTGQTLPINFTDPLLLLLLAGIGILVTLLAGSYPALVLSSFQPSAVLMGGRTTTAGNTSLRKALVVFQFGISVFLIIGTLVVHNQVDYIQTKELGFNKENVVALTSYGEVENRFEAFRSELSQIPGIGQITMASHSPVEIGSGYKIDVDGINEDPDFVINGLRARPEFTDMFNIEIIAGDPISENNFSATNREENPEYAFLVNEKTAQVFGVEPEELIGRRTEVHDRIGTIVGVVDNFHFSSLHNEIEPLMIFPQDGFNKLLVKLTSSDIENALHSLEASWESFFPTIPFEYQFVDQQFDALYRSETQIGYIFTGFSLLAIFVACLGLFGLSSYMVEQRTREIGVRKVLGASLFNILGLFSMDFLKLVITGFLLAVPVAWFVMSDWLQNFAYRIDISYNIMLIAGGLTLLITVMTVSYQAVKAALLNPVESLRSE